MLSISYRILDWCLICGGSQVNVAQPAARELVVEQMSRNELATSHLFLMGLKHGRFVGLGCLGVVWPRAIKDLIAVGASTTWL